MMTEQYTKLIKTLAEIFQLDQADLDFGIYRIMNQKRSEITEYLYEKLPAQVSEILSQAQGSDNATLKKELEDLERNLKLAGVDPDTNAKVQELRAQYQSAGSPEALTNEVFSHLTNFFKRYYSQGDFISQRRYKKDVYAIPYEGEEVKLHWANHDQYYIKTGEYFKNYTFKTADGKTVNFALRDASTEQNNNKAQESKERKFKLAEEDFLTEEGDTLTIWFTYEPIGKTPKQEDLLKQAVKTLKPAIPSNFQYGLLKLMPTEKQKDRTLLEKHLKDYTARNTFDYFIHKDLGGFLIRELDFFIKNEILEIDDINLDAPQSFDRQLKVIKAFKAVSLKIIALLAQLENFQKKLWLKKKFVLQSDWCITLDRIPEAFYPDIAANAAQHAEWVKLFAINEIKGDLHTPAYCNPLSIEFLKANPFLVLDTQFFSTEWKYKLLGQLDNLDENANGLMINSENFQALGNIYERFIKDLTGIYIDPPYNTDASAILYKNDYKDSSWISLMENRLKRAKGLLARSGMISVAIDDEEVSELCILLDSVFPKRLGTAPVRSNPAGRKTKGTLAPAHEFALFFGVSQQSLPGTLELTEKRLSRYPNIDEKGRFAWANFIRSGTNDRRLDRPKMFYPIIVKQDRSIRIPKLNWRQDLGEYEILEAINEEDKLIYPITPDGTEKRWQRGYERVSTELEEYKVTISEVGLISIHFKTYMDESSMPVTWWDKKEYASANYGAAEMKDLFKENPFDFPKARRLVQDCVRVISGNKPVGQYLDFFAGSGTTGHAIIDLNRNDNGKRKFILVEMGNYFAKVTKPRIQKVIYSEDWKNGKPLSRKGSSHAFKYLRLESYEDALNNLELKTTSTQGGLLAGAFGEEYLLNYMLDVESRDSLLNLDMFKRPFGYTIKVTENNELKEQEVDLVETFNYLIGLVVDSMQLIKETVVVQGKNLAGDKILVIWRDVEKMDNAALNEFFKKLEINTKDSEFKRIYVNGDNNLENLRTEDEQWKVMLIEEAFHKLMFDVQDV
jgi:adenine-specific DNA-methyltransferase